MTQDQEIAIALSPAQIEQVIRSVGYASNGTVSSLLVAALDLVISVDTAVVHLAGGLGVPVWILNRFDTCWRWLLGRSDSPWYRSATLFRQLALGDWGSVTREVAAALGGSHGQAV